MRIISGDAIHLERKEAMKDLEDVIRTHYLVKEALKKTRPDSKKAQILDANLKKADAKLEKYGDYLFDGKNPLLFFDAKQFAKGCYLKFNTRTKHDIPMEVVSDEGDYYKQIDDGISDYAIDVV